MTKLPLTPPFEDPESAFHKKDKLVGESSNKSVDEIKFESFENTSKKNEASYEPEIESKRESEPEDEPKTT